MLPEMATGPGGSGVKVDWTHWAQISAIPLSTRLTVYPQAIHLPWKSPAAPGNGFKSAFIRTLHLSTPISLARMGSSPHKSLLPSSQD